MTPTLAVMIGLAVAIDYSLFIVSRFRHELTVTSDRTEPPAVPWAPPVPRSSSPA